MVDGGYDSGYQACNCYWGTEPGSLVRSLKRRIGDVNNLKVLDVGAGEGKNSLFLAAQGAIVTAVECSSIALDHARKLDATKAVNWIEGDIRKFLAPANSFDIVISYGLFHCMKGDAEISRVASMLQQLTVSGGYHVVCTFNNRLQQLKGAHRGFTPCLLPHDYYLNLYRSWNILEQSDLNLIEAHPDDQIEHSHSMTRLIAQKVPL